MGTLFGRKKKRQTWCPQSLGGRASNRLADLLPGKFESAPAPTSRTPGLKLRTASMRSFKSQQALSETTLDVSGRFEEAVTRRYLRSSFFDSPCRRQMLEICLTTQNCNRFRPQKPLHRCGRPLALALDRLIDMFSFVGDTSLLYDRVGLAFRRRLWSDYAMEGHGGTRSRSEGTTTPARYPLCRNRHTAERCRPAGWEKRYQDGIEKSRAQRA